VIWAGDFNCIMSKKGLVETFWRVFAAKLSLDIDSTAQGFWNKMSGLSEEERAGMSNIVHPQDSEEPMLLDVWRHLNPADEEYTCASSSPQPGKGC
jgi:exonuclease III